MEESESKGRVQMNGGMLEMEVAPINGSSAEEHEIPSPSIDSLSTKKRVKTLLRREGPPLKRRLKKQSKYQQQEEDATALIIKYSALFLLVAQMVGLVLLMRISRTTRRDPSQPLYLASTAVFVMEVMKLFLCCFVITFQSGGNLLSEIYEHVVQSPMEMVKLCVPSLLYTVQNNLLYLALSNLDAATYQVCYQLKILTTALFSVILLHRQFSKAKWASLVILTVGVAVVQISGNNHTKSSADAESKHNRFVGLVAVLCAACTSGFSGVYFEKILKGSETSLWMRNVQMGLPSIVIAYLTIYVKDSSAVAKQGFLGGYTSLVWTVVAVQAAGGLIVAVVVKYADNVLKVFATSFSIVISCVIAAVMKDFHPNLAFSAGAALVVVATAMYSSPEPKRQPVLPLVVKSTSTTRKSSLVM